MNKNVFLTQNFCSDVTFKNFPLPKKKYGNDMAKFGPYLTHMWEWYGKVEWLYGSGMGHNLAKF